jgi:hypothetical protein
MEYMLMIYVNEAGWPKLSPAQQEQGMAAYTAYTESMQKSGVFKTGGRLHPSVSAATVRAADGKPSVLDGPYADAKEQLGGFYIIDVPDREAALSWARRCPGTGHGAVEVRQIWR